MPFIDVGTTKRKKMTETRALAAWERTKGVCVNCNQPIDGTRDKWFVEHPRALGLGGEDNEKNTGPAHWDCKGAKDADDTARIAKAKRSKRRDLGITQALKKSPPIQSAGFTPAPKQRRAATPSKLAALPRPSLYGPAE
jgi:5-methylcytosine-specific restriction enzyme A